ncbi:hypothetical protein VKT23_018071 [Stygiomarasmius scandens]|uniref:Uncharacterized protein n=1 Tax=Marasmiellus scandens TaxID=2682957 RepID=A0ABR1IS03_9AGAR
MSRKETDAILPMTDYDMQNIVCKEKNYEFRRYLIAPSVCRIWFYLKAPLSHIAYICEIDPARTRNFAAGDDPLEENGLGNKQFNEVRDGDWERVDYAYGVRSVYKLREPISLHDMKEKYGFKMAPRGLVYVNEEIKRNVIWDEQICLWTEEIDEKENAIQDRSKE